MKVAVDLFAVSQYVMIDLSPALELQRQYLAHHQGALDVVQWVQVCPRRLREPCAPLDVRH